MSSYTVAYGERLQEARAYAGLTQDELGRHIGLTRSSVANIEAGRQPQTAEQVMTTARALGCDPRWLLTGWTVDTPGPTALPVRAIARHIVDLRLLATRLEEAALPSRP